MVQLLLKQRWLPVTLFLTLRMREFVGWIRACAPSSGSDASQHDSHVTAIVMTFQSGRMPIQGLS